jgi:hypothetical protein
MRQLLITKEEQFDLTSIQKDIEAVVSAFDEYLDEYPAKTKRTMHGLMGPVPMILDGVRVHHDDFYTLAGKATRAHEMASDSHYVSPEALSRLENALAKLFELCKQVPVTAINKVTERIRYNLYYRRRKKFVEGLEQVRVQFGKYLQDKYVNEKDLREAWGEEEITFASVPYPSEKQAEKASGKKKEDIKFFRSLPTAEKFKELIEEGEE